MRALITGESEPAAALAGALRDGGAEAELIAGGARPTPRAVADLARELTEFERVASAAEFDVAIAIGLGDAPLALALVAAKLGIPLLTCQRDEPQAGDDQLDRAEWRILGELAEERLEMPGESVGADVIAQRITTRVAAGEVAS